MSRTLGNGLETAGSVQAKTNVCGSTWGEASCEDRRAAPARAGIRSQTRASERRRRLARKPAHYNRRLGAAGGHDRFELQLRAAARNRSGVDGSAGTRVESATSAGSAGRDALYDKKRSGGRARRRPDRPLHVIVGFVIIEGDRSRARKMERAPESSENRSGSKDPLNSRNPARAKSSPARLAACEIRLFSQPPPKAGASSNQRQIDQVATPRFRRLANAASAPPAGHSSFVSLFIESDSCRSGGRINRHVGPS